MYAREGTLRRHERNMCGVWQQSFSIIRGKTWKSERNALIMLVLCELTKYMKRNPRNTRGVWNHDVGNCVGQIIWCACLDSLL